jgi:hypothetical protein
VQGYPTIKYFEYGAKSQASAKPYEYGRDQQSITAFANDLLDKADIQPELHEIFKQKTYAENCKGTVICVVTFVPNIYDSDAAERNGYLDTLLKVAKNQRKQPFEFFWL